MKPKDLFEKPSILTLNLLIISGAHLVSHVFGSIHTALFPVFRDEFNLSLQQLGLIAAIPPLCRVFSYIPSGLVADRFGQKTLIIFSFITAGVSAIAMGFSSNLAMLIISLSVLTTSITIYHPPAYSLTSEIFPREIRGRALGIHGAGGTLGMAFGPISLSIFLGYLLWGWRSIYLFWAFPILIYILAILRLQNPDQKREPVQGSEQEVEVDGESATTDGGRSLFTLGLIGFMMFRAMQMMGRQIMQTYIPTYIHDDLGLSVAKASFIYGVAPLSGVVAAPIGGYLTDRLGDKKWLMTGISLYTFFLLLSAFTSNIFLFSLFYWCSGFFFASQMGAASSILARSTPRGRRGLGYALYFMPGSIVSSLAPIIGAYVATAFSLWSIFPISIIVLGISIVMLKYVVPST